MISFPWAIVPIVLFMALWEFAARLWIDNPALLPPFTAVVREVKELIRTGELWHHFHKSLIRVLIGFGAGSLAGLLMGIMLGWKEIVHRSLHPVISLLYPIPALGWLPIFMLWFGIGELLPIAVIFMCSFFPVLYNTESGIRSVNPVMIRAARSLGASDTVILTTILLPLSLPAVFTGLRLEAGMAWRVIIAAEMVAIPTGIGALLMRAESLVRVDIVIVCLMVLSVMCFIFEQFFLLLEKRITGRW
jgi:NitT/TauT family transport system permease protein